MCPYHPGQPKNPKGDHAYEEKTKNGTDPCRSHADFICLPGNADGRCDRAEGRAAGNADAGGGDLAGYGRKEPEGTLSDSGQHQLRCILRGWNAGL